MKIMGFRDGVLVEERRTVRTWVIKEIVKQEVLVNYECHKDLSSSLCLSDLWLLLFSSVSGLLVVPVCCML